MRVERFLEDSAARSPDKTALVAGGRRLSFAELDTVSDRLAAALTQRGLQRGERVIVFMDNCWEAVAGIFAVLKAGGVFSPINPSTKADKLAYVINNCRASAILAQERVLGVVEQAQPQCPSLKFRMIAERDFAPALARDAAAPALPGIDIDLCMLVYTSGSTGFPWGVMMTHQNVVAAATSITAYLENTADDIVLNVLPISFDYGLYQVLMAMKVGATLVLEKSFAFPQAIFNRMKEEKVTGLPLVPTMAAMILGMKDLKPANSRICAI
jgi:acyl-CoA synthetase (AMP-forming)/AMP-acid ligase II